MQVKNTIRVSIGINLYELSSLFWYVSGKPLVLFLRNDTFKSLYNLTTGHTSEGIYVRENEVHQRTVS